MTLTTASIRPFLARRLVIMAAGIALGALPGCGDQFADIETTSGKTRIVYDDRALDALEGVFGKCIEPLAIEAGATSVSLAPSCSFADLDGSDEATMALALAAQGDIELGSAIPSLITSSREVISGLPWPVQNCEITVDMDVYFDSIRLYDLAASWGSSGGQPQLHVDFDFSENKVGEVDIDVDVDCPHSLGEAIVNGLTKKLRAALEGTHDINTSGRDLDIYFTFGRSGSELTADLDVDFQVNNLWLDVDWSDIETISILWYNIDVIDRDDVEEPARQLFESLGGEMFAAALSDLPDTVAGMLADPIEDGHVICSVSADSSSFTIETAKGTSQVACYTAAKKTTGLILPPK